MTNNDIVVMLVIFGAVVVGFVGWDLLLRALSKRKAAETSEQAEDSPVLDGKAEDDEPD